MINAATHDGQKERPGWGGAGVGSKRNTRPYNKAFSH